MCSSISKKINKHIIHSSRINFFLMWGTRPATTQIDHSGNITSDHAPIITTFEIFKKSLNAHNPAQNSTWRYNSDKLLNSDNKTTMQMHINSKIKLMNDLQSPSDKINMITQVTQEWCNKHIQAMPGAKHRRNAGLGTQCKYIKKMVKSQ